MKQVLWLLGIVMIAQAQYAIGEDLNEERNEMNSSNNRFKEFLRHQDDEFFDPY